jgi:hypothetical protein
MKMNGVHYEELACFFTKATMQDEVLGIPIDYTVNPKTRKIDYVYSTMELVSHRAWHSQNLSKTVWGETIKGWLPVYLSEDHFLRGAQLLPSCLRRIVNDPSTQDHFGRTRQSAPSPSLVDMILEIFPKLMNTMVVLLVDNGIHEVDHTLKGYGMVHRMFLTLVNRVPGLRAEVSKRLQSFLKVESMRTKSACPNLGEFMALLSVCPDVGWMDMVVPLIREGFSRSVLWVCRDVPELAALPAMVKSNTSEAELSELMQKVFRATDNSRKIYSFHCCFLKLLANPRGIDGQVVSQRYDKTLGMLPLHVSKRLQSLLEEAVSFDSWQSFFAGVCLKPPSNETLVGMWADAVQASMSKGYHSASTDFSKIQRRGVSNILLRGTSYGKVVLCIDVSGSMGSYINFSGVISSSSMSRLDFVKQQLKDVFCARLTHRQQFTVMRFDNNVYPWTKGLLQATEENLRSAVQHVQSWNPQGGTNFSSALEAAFAVEGVQAIYFLSDGEDYDYSGRLLARVNLLSQNKKVHLHTTAFYASAAGQQTMKALAEATGGTYLNYGHEDDDSSP